MKYFGIFVIILFKILICKSDVYEEAFNGNGDSMQIAIAELFVNPNDNVNMEQIRHIEDALHWKSNPCENFLHFACGNWPYFMETDVLDIRHVVDAKNNMEFAMIFELQNPKFPAINFMGQVRNYYGSCRRVQKRGKALNPLEYLKWLEFNENLIWVAFDNRSDGPKRNNRAFNWVQMLAIFRKYGLNNFIIHEEVVQHPWNNTKTVTALKKPYAESATHFLGSQEDEHRKFTLWNISDSLDHRAFVEFDLKLKKVVDYHSNGTETRPQFITFKQLKDMQLEWLAVYLIIISHPVPVEPQMEIYIEDIGYMKTIKLFLDEVEDTQLLARYLQLNFLSQSINGFHDPGYYDCTPSTRLQFPLAMQWLYKYLHPEISHDFYEIHQLFTNLKRIMRKKLSTFFNGKARDYVVGKIDNIKLKMLNVWQPSLEHFYESLHLDPFDYVGNRLKLKHKYFRSSHSNSAGKVTQGAFEFLNLDSIGNVESVLPFLVPRQNRIILPVMALQFPIYHPKFNETFLYSSLGYLLALELTKAFSQENWNIDANSNLSQESLRYFNSSFMASDGEQHISDFALDLALQAFMAVPSFSQDELKFFLLNFAHNHCSNYMQFPYNMEIVNSGFKRIASTTWFEFNCDFK